MNRIILNKEQVYEFVADSIYLPTDSESMLSRGIDGNYLNSPDLPALALPGGDAGELAVLYAAGKVYSFEVDYKKAFEVLSSLVGEDNFSSTDSYLTQVTKDPSGYSLTEEDINILAAQLKEIKIQKVSPYGDHHEGAILMVRGNYGILPQATVYTDLGKKDVQVFVYHRSLVDKRRKILAKELVEKNAVTLYEGLDEEYLYEILTDVGDNHFFETIKKTAAGLSLYAVTIDKPSKIDIKELEII